MRVMGNYVLVKIVEPEKQTSSGIILTNQKPDEGMMGEVLAVGDGIWAEKFVTDLATGEVHKDYEKKPVNAAIVPGVTVFFPRWAGFEIEVDSEKLLLIREHDLLGYLEG